MTDTHTNCYAPVTGENLQTLCLFTEDGNLMLLTVGGKLKQNGEDIDYSDGLYFLKLSDDETQPHTLRKLIL